MRSRKPKLSIDLNRPTPEEDYGGCREKIGDAPEKKKIKKLQEVIKELKHEKQPLELWKDKLQDKIEKLKEKNKEQRELSNKVRKMNIKIYWSNVVLKTKLKQENSKARCRFEDQVLNTST
jgi:predicted RNase H-like nuclease (RuvC/YqgF family)